MNWILSAIDINELSDRISNKLYILLKNKPNEDINDILLKPVEYLKLSARAYNTVRCLPARTIGELVEFEIRDLKKRRNCGPKTLSEIIEALDKNGLKLSI